MSQKILTLRLAIPVIVPAMISNSNKRTPMRTRLYSILLKPGLTVLVAISFALSAKAGIESFPVGNSPAFFAFDGANVWVSSSGDDTVTKLRASDGASLGTFATGDGPLWITFDGANIWVSNTSGNTVTKLRASDGA